MSVFFFQAEDGIRDFHVTGVQTCALPSCYFGVKVIHVFPGNTQQGLPGLHAAYTLYSARTGVPLAQVDGDVVTVYRTAGAAALRSEERRVGKESKDRGSAVKER